MTQEIFLQLLKDTSKGKDVFDRFLQKNHNIFEQMIGIKFSGKKYMGIDVEGIYFNGFMDYTIGQLKQSKHSMPFNDWVGKLAEDRALYIRSDVNKCLIKSCIEKGGKERWDWACELIPKEYSSVIKRVVSRNFDNIKYCGYHDDVTSTFLTLFYLDRVENPYPISCIESLEPYLFRMLDNLAKKKQTHDVIDLELGLDHDDIEVEKYAKSEDEESEAVETDVSPMDDTSMEEESLLEQSDNKAEEWAKMEIERLLGLMPTTKEGIGKSSDADLIRKIMLWKYDYEELANEENDTIEYMYVRKDRAMIKFISVSLPDIKEKCKEMFVQYSCYLTKKYQKKILEEFFLSNRSLPELALSHGKTEKAFREDVAKAFKLLKKISQKKQEEYTPVQDVETYLEEETRKEAESTMKVYRLNHKKN